MRSFKVYNLISAGQCEHDNDFKYLWTKIDLLLV